MKLYTKEQLIDAIKNISDQGWHKSVKKTIDRRNDGAVGNTLESLLGIKENNLPLPNAREWELKGQRKHTSSLITLKHIEPSPTGAKIVSSVLLPLYGWKHKEAGKKYPKTEKSFRSTTSATAHTNRGFRVIVDKSNKKILFAFDASKADTSNPEISAWLNTVRERVGLGHITPEPYWAFDDLKYIIGSKIMNCFYVIANTKIEDKHEYFKYEKLLILSGFSFEKFLDCAENGYMLVDFDARTGHNHGTKFRLKQDKLPSIYESVTMVE
ncbi:MAG: MvaI/BcnI restriction endonuclease family protein [Nitrospirae bacterium]|nr:MvaI/BcnI restriction endonuclease family protein [Nitrospirota bacterium]